MLTLTSIGVDQIDFSLFKVLATPRTTSVKDMSQEEGEPPEWRRGYPTGVNELAGLVGFARERSCPLARVDGSRNGHDFVKEQRGREDVPFPFSKHPIGHGDPFVKVDSLEVLRRAISSNNKDAATLYFPGQVHVTESVF